MEQEKTQVTGQETPEKVVETPEKVVETPTTQLVEDLNKGKELKFEEIEIELKNLKESKNTNDLLQGFEKMFNQFTETNKELANRIKELESEKIKELNLKTLDSQVEELIKGTNINKSEIKEAIGFNEIKDDETLKTRVEKFKKILFKNAGTEGVGKPDPKAKQKAITDFLNNKYNKEQTKN